MNTFILLLGIAGVIVLCVAVLLAVGALAKGRCRAQFPHPGRMVDIGGYKLHLTEAGVGDVTVVMEAGVGDFGLIWAHVQPEVARFARVVMYDRAGYGWSEPSPQPRTAAVMVDELHRLLSIAGVARPYVLVGHSFGGALIRLYANQHPDDVAGIVLVDSAHEQQYQCFPEPIRNTLEKLGTMQLLTLRVLGLLIASGIAALKPSLIPAESALPHDMRQAYQAVRATDTKNIATMMAELRGITESLAQIRTARITSLGDIPLVVLSHGQPQRVMGMADEVNQAYEQTWQELQDELAASSSCSTRLVARESGHYVQLDQPALVVDAISEVVDAARRASPGSKHSKQAAKAVATQCLQR